MILPLQATWSVLSPLTGWKSGVPTKSMTVISHCIHLIQGLPFFWSRFADDFRVSALAGLIPCNLHSTSFWPCSSKRSMILMNETGESSPPRKVTSHFASRPWPWPAGQSRSFLSFDFTCMYLFFLVCTMPTGSTTKLIGHDCTTERRESRNSSAAPGHAQNGRQRRLDQGA
jgi:hypothetical protein